MLKSIAEVLWARRLIVLICTFCTLVGGAFIAATAAPRYQASARVIMDYIKPDPITGEFVNNKQLQAYLNTQVRTIRDFQVAIPAAEALGLLDNIDVQTHFNSIPGSNPADFPLWVARSIISSTAVELVPETNIIKIVVAAPSAEAASQYADAVRTAYVEATLQAKRTGAAAGADRLATMASMQAAELAKLEAAKRKLEDTHGAMPAVEAARLTEMVAALRPLYVEQAPTLPSAERLAIVDAQLAEVAKTLGPNHPKLQALRAQRELISRQLQLETAAAAAVGQGAGIAERARQTAIDAQKEKVLSQRPIALETRLIEEEIARRKETIEGLNTRIADMRQLASLQQVNLIPLGEVETRSAAVFPNPYLILGGATFLGFTLGSLLALFTEFTNRRVRRPDHLSVTMGAPMLGAMPLVLNAPSAVKARPFRPLPLPRRIVRKAA